MRMISLNMVRRNDNYVAPIQSDASDTDEVGGAEAPAPVASSEPEEISVPVSINVEAIRCFYTRKENRPGTRITFTDGGGFAVTEDYDTVKGMVTPN